MHKEINLQLADGTVKEFSFLACGTTSIRFRQLFKKELLAGITGIVSPVNTDKLIELARMDQKKKEEGSDGVSLEDMDPDTLQVLLSIAGSGELDTISKMAFIMNQQAEGAEMSKLDLDKYLDWLEQFESMEFLTHTMDFVGLYMNNRQATSVPKKEAAQLTGK